MVLVVQRWRDVDVFEMKVEPVELSVVISERKLGLSAVCLGILQLGGWECHS